MDEQPKVVRVGRYRLTPQFVERVCKHYVRKVREGMMPTAIHGGLQSPDTFGPNVNAKSAHLLDVIGARDGDTERAFHEATQRFATQYGVGELPVPKFADEPEEPKGEDQQQQGQQSPESKPSDEPQGDDEGGEGDESESGGEGDSEGQQDGGRGASESEGDDDSDDASGSTMGGNSRPELADEPEELDLKAQLPRIANYHERDLPEREPHPIPRYQAEWCAPKVHSFDLGRTTQLFARLRAELMAVSRHRAYRDKDSGDVDFTKLVDLAQGTNLDRVFYTMTHAKRLNTAVQMHVDISGSMGGAKLTTATALSYVLGSALEKLRIPVEIVAFGDSPYLVKAWHERMDACCIRRLSTAGGTDLPKSMTDGVLSLGKRREARLIQAIITDGDVGWGGGYVQAIAALEQNVRDGIGDRGYMEGIIAEYRKSAELHSVPLRAFYRSCPRLEAYAFGVGVEVPAGLFHRSVSNIQPGNMVDVIVETLGRALIRKN